MTLIKDPPVAITDNLWMLGTNAYPVYLFQGESEIALFEGGIGPIGPVVREQLKELEIDTGLIKQLVIPHAHPDHVMAIPLFREILPNLSVTASDVAAKTLRAEKAISFFCKLDEALTGALLQAGLIGEQHRPKPLAEMQIPVDRTVKEGDTIEVDGTRFEVLQMSGHSDCSLSFYDSAGGLLFASDAIPYFLPEHNYFWPCYFNGYEPYLGSLRRLAELGAKVLCLGHHAVIREAEHVASFFGDAIAATEAYHRHIVEETNAGKPRREIAEQLGSQMYEKVRLFPLDFFQKNCNLLVKQSLMHEGIEVNK